MNAPSHGHNTLADLAERIRLASTEMQTAEHVAAEKAIEKGLLLIEAKQACGHGQWLPFLQRADVPERDAQRLMTLAKSGLKSAAVAVLGVRAACDLAEKRKLPQKGFCLQISVGDPQPEAFELSQDGEIVAWVWEDADHPKFFHVASWSDRLSVTDDAIVASGTKKPINGDASFIVFATVDELLCCRFAEMRFELLPLTIRGRVAREMALEFIHPEFDGEKFAGAVGVGGRVAGGAP
jgi:hypothetical protein